MLKLYNSLSRKKEKFIPLRKGEVKIYSCGPTVYDFAHIGNFRSYIAWDLLIRFLRYLGYKTNVVKNITDVGHFTDDDEDRGVDKFEKAARKEKKNPLDIARFYTKVFIQQERKLNILPPDFLPRATREIRKMQEIIKILVKKGYGYDARDGVYFAVSQFKKYGRLSGNTPEKILAGARVEINTNKKHPADFALWIKRVGKNRLHTLHWPSPWGDGFPGWHIECSAMAIKYLGETIDIHTGGKDNKFPHHESEIAQSEAYTGKTFSRYFLHSNHVDINSKKMSKSLGNFYTLQNIIDKGFDPLAYRFWTLTAHYRSPMNFTWKGLEEASSNWKKIVDFYFTHSKFKNNNGKLIKKYNDKFILALSDDLNTPKAIALLLEIIRESNKNPQKIPAVTYLIKKWDQVLGILPSKIKKPKNVAIPAKIKTLVAERQIAREGRDFKKADKIRKQIEKLGYEVVDMVNGNYTVKRIEES